MIGTPIAADKKSSYLQGVTTWSTLHFKNLLPESVTDLWKFLLGDEVSIDCKKPLAELLKECALDACVTLFLPKLCWTAMDSFLKAYRLLLAEGEPGSMPSTIASIIPARTVLLEACNRHAAVVAKAVLTCFPCDCAWNTSTCRYAAAVFQHILSRAREVYEELTLDEADPARCDGPPDVTFAYNPPRDGAAYYFNMDGRRVRKVRRVKGLDDDDNEATYDDAPIVTCEKLFSKMRSKAYAMFFLCPLHGHCWGELWQVLQLWPSFT